MFKTLEQYVAALKAKGGPQEKRDNITLSFDIPRMRWVARIDRGDAHCLDPIPEHDPDMLTAAFLLLKKNYPECVKDFSDGPMNAGAEAMARERMINTIVGGKDCKHYEFHASVIVNRLEDTGRFQADVSITCAGCGIPMRFIGLPAGLDLNGASTSADATECRLAIAPKGEVQSVVDGAPMGFSVRSDKNPKEE